MHTHSNGHNHRQSSEIVFIGYNLDRMTVTQELNSLTGCVWH
jgi:hypothetical protein